jgi:fructose-1,6-bisphosphatase/inositol monophosphatase family enzyme
MIDRISSVSQKGSRPTHLNSVSALTESDLKSILSVATTAAKKAGQIIVSNAGGADVTKTKANPRDLLTMIDPLCEKAIRETVLASFPSHDFLGEEDVPPGKEASAAALDAKLKTDKDFLWIVDVSKVFEV